jgi:hypothetical protein
MGATHTWGGVNYADAFNMTMTLAGIGLMALGAALLLPWDGLMSVFRPRAALSDGS